MKKDFWNNLAVVVLLGLSISLAPALRAQSSVTQVVPVPDGAQFFVDGQPYSHAMSGVWPNGSAHVLWVPNLVQTPLPRVMYTFGGWQTPSGIPITVNPFTITASPAIASYQAQFSVSYGLGVAMGNCTGSACPGTIYGNGTPFSSSQDNFVGSGSVVSLQAVPNPGFVFVGWQPGPGQVITGFQDQVTVNGPITVYPNFKPAESVNFATVPSGLTILADGSPLYAPAQIYWGMNTVHTVGANSPQRDLYGKAWVFQSWSDGGAANHAYTVAPLTTPATLTATYGPGVAVDILTQPSGLKITVDGQYNPLDPYYFVWGIGETHTLAAPAQQTDAQGNVWQFSSWSNGGAASQSVVVPVGADSTGIKLTATYTSLTKLTVTSSLSGLVVNVDGAACTTPCTVVRAPGAQVKLNAPASVPFGPGARADFDGWPGTSGDLTLTVGNTTQTVNASYHMMNQLTTASSPQNGAVWTIAPVSPDGFYSTGTNVALSLAPQPGYRFRQWTGDLSGTYPAGAVAMSAPRAVTALFDVVPYVAPTAVNNAAGTTPQTGVAPGSIISIFGANLTTSTALAPAGQLPQSLAGLTVSVGSRILPLLFASPTQINAQLPDDMSPGQAAMTISPTGQTNLQTSFTIVRNAPGLFPVPAAGGIVLAMATHADGTAVTVDSPAVAGELLTVYGTGFGPATVARPLGYPVQATPSDPIVDSVTVTAGTETFPAQNSFAAPGQIGVDVVQFSLDGSQSGNLAFKVTVNGVDSNSLTLVAQ